MNWTILVQELAKFFILSIASNCVLNNSQILNSRYEGQIAKTEEFHDILKKRSRREDSKFFQKEVLGK